MNTRNSLQPFVIAVFAVVVAVLLPSSAKAQTGLSFFPLNPCRVVDTRDPVGTNGGPAMTTASRDFEIRGHCGIPTTAKAVAINVTVVNASTFSWLTVWPSGTSKPFVSTLNYDQNSGAVANGAIVGVSTNAQDLSVANAVGVCNVIIDVNGYFK